jgi:phage tail sheath gpL-like
MEYDFEKIAQAIVVERLKDAADPAAVAGEVVHKIAVAALKGTNGRQEPRVTIAAACRGVMAGMLLIDKDLPKTAIALLDQMALIAHESDLDPAECMTWAMEGIAPVVKAAPPGAADAIGAAIEERFMGAREAFQALMDAAGSR